MDTWQLSIKIDENPEEMFELIDVKGILDGYLNVERTFFDELLGIVKMIQKYSVGKGINKVIGPDKEDWTRNPWLLIMFKDNENEIPFWLLIKREKDLTGFVVAIGPETFYEYCKASDEPDNEIKRIIEYIVAYPQKFKTSVIIPNFIE